MPNSANEKRRSLPVTVDATGTHVYLDVEGVSPAELTESEALRVITQLQKAIAKNKRFMGL